MYTKLIHSISRYGETIDKQNFHDEIKILDYNFKPGVYTISSATGGGKSTLAKEIAQQASGLFVEFLEPTASSLLSIEELAKYLESHNVEAKQVIIIDSLRTLQYQGDGAAMAGGVSADFWELLTRLTILALRHRLIIFLVINPMIHENRIKEEAYHLALESSTTGVITGSIDKGWSIKSRYNDRKQQQLDEGTRTTVSDHLTPVLSEQTRIDYNMNHSYQHDIDEIYRVISELKKQGEIL